jgi:hypothetical protein
VILLGKTPAVPAGYTICGTDLNKGPGGDYIYIEFSRVAYWRKCSFSSERTGVKSNNFTPVRFLSCRVLKSLSNSIFFKCRYMFLFFIKEPLPIQ